MFWFLFFHKEESTDLKAKQTLFSVGAYAELKDIPQRGCGKEKETLRAVARGHFEGPHVWCWLGHFSFQPVFLENLLCARQRFIGSVFHLSPGFQMSP